MFKEFENINSKDITVQYRKPGKETIDFREMGFVWQWLFINNNTTAVALNYGQGDVVINPGQSILMPGHPYLRNTSQITTISFDPVKKDCTFILSILQK